MYEWFCEPVTRYTAAVTVNTVFGYKAVEDKRMICIVLVAGNINTAAGGLGRIVYNLTICDLLNTRKGINTAALAYRIIILRSCVCTD